MNTVDMLGFGVRFLRYTLHKICHDVDVKEHELVHFPLRFGVVITD